MLNPHKIAVISTGNGGQSMAAYFSSIGFEVSLYARERERAEMFPKNRVFKMSGLFVDNPTIHLISSDMSEVIRDAHLIMVTTPTQYQQVVAAEMASSLEDGQIIVLNPGRTFGTYVFLQTLAEHGNTCKVVLAEAETFLFACRCTRIAEPVIHGIKEHIRVAAHDPADTQQVVDTLSFIIPDVFVPAQNTLETSFSNVGMIFHPLPILLNITRVEKKEKFLFYREGISPLVANILDRMDQERVAVALGYGIPILSAYDWLKEHYNSEGDNLYERIQNTDAYANIYAPVDIDTRYIFEDMLTGCVPFYCAGKAINIDTPIIKSSILWASTVYETDFIQHGRNEKRIDLEAIAGICK